MRIKVRADELKPGDKWGRFRVETVGFSEVDWFGKSLPRVTVRFSWTGHEDYSKAYRPSEPFHIQREA